MVPSGLDDKCGKTIGPGFGAEKSCSVALQSSRSVILSDARESEALECESKDPETSELEMRLQAF